MQDRYAGDVGDFGKFGLLRHLLVGRLGVVWYFYANHDESNNDGRHTSFYGDTSLTDCDSELARTLHRTVLTTTQRCVAALETPGVLPAQTKYFRNDINFYAIFPGQTQKNKYARHEARNHWLKLALNAVQDCPVVFLDPDNGLEIASCSKKSQKKAGKYAFMDEVKAFKKHCEVLIVYHHLNMGSPHELQTKMGVERLAAAFERKVSVFALRFSPYSPRAFFIICSPNAYEDIDRRLNAFLRSPWGQYWDTYKTYQSDAAHSANSDSSQSICN